MISVMTKSGILILLLAAFSTSYTDLVFAQPLCNSLDATIIGTPDDNVIDGTSGPDVIVGLAGNDEINGLGGDDVICGGIGNDLIRGGDGDDQLFGGQGADILRGNTGKDLLNGSGGSDFLNGGLNADECRDQLGFNHFSNCEGHSGVIGPDGGIITSRDGRLTITFPPGALSENTEIVIKGNKPSVYQLKPKGIEFNIPVTVRFLTDETPAQEDGSIVSEGILLFTTSNGKRELLNNLTQKVNADENTTTVSGKLSHFSDLSASTSGIIVSVSGVPGSLPDGGNFSLFTFIENVGGLVELTENSFDNYYSDSSYKDLSVLPVLDLYTGKAGFSIPMGSDNNNKTIGPREVFCKCDSAGIGKYKSRIKVVFTLSQVYEEEVFNFSKSVNCEDG